MVHNIELEQCEFLNAQIKFKQRDWNRTISKGKKAAGNFLFNFFLFYATKRMTFSKLLTRSSEMSTYKSLIRPVVRYGCDIWVLKDVVGKH